MEDKIYMKTKDDGIWEKNFTISFYNEKNELCNAKFSNCFDKIVNDIKEKY